jgi:hypothetical protein
MNSKSLPLVIFAAWFFSTAQAQYVTIPDANFVTWLQSNGFGSCLNGSQLDTSCYIVKNTTEIDCEWSEIASLEGLQHFSNLRDLKCNNNNLVNLPFLPPRLRKLTCYYNQLIALPELPDTLLTLNCSDNAITLLPELPDSLRGLICGLNSLTDLPQLPAGLKQLNFGGNDVTALQDLPSGLNYLLCNANLLTALPPLPATLIYLSCNDNLLTEIPPVPDSLSYFSCHHNLLTHLPALPTDATLLLNCSNNLLSSLPPLPDNLVWLNCSYNFLDSLPSVAHVTYLNCSNNQLNAMTDLAPALNLLDVSNNPDLHCLPSVYEITSQCYLNFSIENTGIVCLPNPIQHADYCPAIDTTPVCDSSNVYGCAFFTSISAFQLSGAMRIFPNPSSGCVNFELNGLQGKLTIFDSIGRFLKNVDVTNNVVTTDLPQGLIQYLFVTNYGEVHSGKIIVL